jgi:hypothetical protein
MSNFNLRSNFTSRCKVKYFDEGEKWWCPKQLSGQFDKEDTHCYLSICPGRQLTDTEDEERLLKIEEKMLAQGKKKKSNLDPMERLFKKIEKIAKKEMDAENLDNKKPIKKSAPIKKNIKNEDTAPQVIEKEPIIITEPVIIIEPPKEPLVIEQVAIAVVEPEPTMVVVEPELSTEQEPIEPLNQNLKKCEWRLCDQYFAIGVSSSKKEKFCCPKCRKKDSRSRWRDRKRELGFVPN